MKLSIYPLEIRVESLAEPYILRMACIKDALKPIRLFLCKLSNLHYSRGVREVASFAKIREKGFIVRQQFGEMPCKLPQNE
jgi:hypothetical protein